MSYVLFVCRWLNVICNEIGIRLVNKYCEYIVAENCCSRLIVRRVVINEISTQSTYLVNLVKWLLCRLSVAPKDRTSIMAIADWFSRIIKGLQSSPPDFPVRQFHQFLASDFHYLHTSGYYPVPTRYIGSDPSFLKLANNLECPFLFRMKVIGDTRHRNRRGKVYSMFCGLLSVCVLRRNP